VSRHNEFKLNGEARRVIEALLGGMTKVEAYEHIEGQPYRQGCLRQKVSRNSREKPHFDAALHIAEAAPHVRELAIEMDDPELRDLYGFMRVIALRQLERFER